MTFYSAPLDASRLLRLLAGVLTFSVIVAPKSAVVATTLLALLGSVWMVRYGNWRKLFRPHWVILAVLLIWSLISCAWSLIQAESLGHAIKAAMICFAGVVLYESSSGLRDQFSESASAIVIGAVAGLFVLLGVSAYTYIQNDAVWGSFSNDPFTTLNNNAIVLSLILWPVTYALYRKRPAAGFVFLLAGFGLLSYLSSGAALTGAVLGGAALTLSHFVGRRFLSVVAVLAFGAMVFAPLVVSHSGIDRFATPEGFAAESSVPSSIRHRLAIWSFVSDKISEKPILGWGQSASRQIDDEPYRLDEDTEILPLHPHNISLQTRLELGLPGIILLGLFFLVLFFRFLSFRFASDQMGLALAVAVNWLLVAHVSVGMWQSWWIGISFLLAVLLRFLLAAYPDKLA